QARTRIRASGSDRYEESAGTARLGAERTNPVGSTRVRKLQLILVYAQNPCREDASGPGKVSGRLGHAARDQPPQAPHPLLDRRGGVEKPLLRPAAPLCRGGASHGGGL